MIADLLAREVDFFSIGTNDLIQFTLAVDRMNDKISHMYEPLHPAVLRMLRTTVEAARSAGIHVGVCGELAGDPSALPVWLGMDVDELSMSSHSILHIKELLLRTPQRDSRSLYDAVMACATTSEVKKLLKEHREAADRFRERTAAGSE
jgi:phosphotransferase system enzyme I (PtsI)